MKHGLTLIELLVVIAIIAILAAILFPVFAQAKVQAKGTASLSNTKQHALAAIMYSTDSDDVAVQDSYWQKAGTCLVPADMCWGGTGVFPWTWTILPYTKNTGIFNDPLTSAVPIPGSWSSIGDTDNWITGVGLEYGYDYTVLSPSSYGSVDVNGSWLRNPISLTSIARPADVVLFTEHETYTEFPAYWYGAGTLITLYGSEAPKCPFTAQIYCFSNWGANAWWYGDGFTNVNEGANTGLVPFRKTNTTPTAFTDGHAKVYTAGALSAGTNWQPTQNESLTVITNANIYHWISTQ